ncbi:sensor histidine kinase [Methylocaldum szegediense]|uniref:histidine kinase n=1 Tax=Methylocaldum szegediense TaxID=73780 RepID=A0ABM9I3Y2_9GAMM|nr:ATP-binding protein [Methylocaldum szegediense]CAI8874398.1 two-component system, OmpR family, osmolarity sensor histidine kinase EnvZ [Methylocaldum szegediense]
MSFAFPPRSLTVRLFLLLLAGVLLAVFVTLGLALRERSHIVHSFREQGAADRIADILHLLSVLPPEQRLAAVHALPSGQWSIRAAGEAAEPVQSQPSFTAALSEAAGPTVLVETAWRTVDSDCPDGGEADCPPSRTLGARVRFADGQRVVIEARREMPPPRQPGAVGFIVNLSILAGLLAILAWFAVRLVLQPLRRLVQAAESFGLDPDHPAVDESGPIEVRQAARTFNRMRERLRSHIEERTRILAAITHDLKTPLTRLRLRLEQCRDEPLRARLVEDVAAMQALVDEGLDLARSLDSGPPPQIVDLSALLQSLCDDTVDAGGEVRFDGPDGALTLGRPEALRRSFANLIDNAVKYGGKADISLKRSGGNWLIRITDSGPGIPEEYLEKVMQPFFRLETSRSRETGGTGLGLSIAANLLAAQGGTLSLHNRPQGGLEARVRLPVSRSQAKTIRRQRAIGLRRFP